MEYIIAYDLGTGGTKASLFDRGGKIVDSTFIGCETYYSDCGYREQKPEDWWKSVVESTRQLLETTKVNNQDIKALAVSGHSLGIVPVSKKGGLLKELVPIWSDSRGSEYARKVFETISEKEWYERTGNGFPAGLYSVFKIMHLKEACPEIYEKTDSFIGTKDYVNYKLTGRLCTDHSYASGCGAYDLKKRAYIKSYIAACNLDMEKMPEILESTDLVGTIEKQVADELGLSSSTQVMCGGVDNSCMALGAACIQNGDSYTSLGTSAWIAISSDEPIINYQFKPYVFAHCVPNNYVSATAIFSAGNSHKWVKSVLCENLEERAKEAGVSVYDVMNELCDESKVGSNGLIFNPSLAGGSSLDASEDIKGCFTGLELKHTQGDLIRATMEGISLNLRLALDALESQVKLSDEMLIVGGGAKSKVWSQIFADTYEKTIILSSIGQNAGSLGAAAIAAVGCGMWENFDKLKEIFVIDAKIPPKEENVAVYDKIRPIFQKIAVYQSEIGGMIQGI